MSNITVGALIQHPLVVLGVLTTAIEGEALSASLLHHAYFIAALYCVYDRCLHNKRSN